MGGAMTAAELIKQLRKYPPDTPVIYQCCSEYEALREGDVTLVTKEEKKIAFHESRFMKVERIWVDQEKYDNWTTVIVFPGN